MSPLKLIFSTGHLSLLRVMTKVFCLCYSGGSVVKIVYRSKANLDEAESNVSCYIGHQPSLRITFSAKGARRQVQDGALAPPWILHTIAQSLTQKNCQTLFYRVKYTIRCWCSKSRHHTG